jgi:hypothetical protein
MGGVATVPEETQVTRADVSEYDTALTEATGFGLRPGATVRNVVGSLTPFAFVAVIEKVYLTPLVRYPGSIR